MVPRTYKLKTEGFGKGFLTYVENEEKDTEKCNKYGSTVFNSLKEQLDNSTLSYKNIEDDISELSKIIFENLQNSPIAILNESSQFIELTNKIMKCIMSRLQRLEDILSKTLENFGKKFENLSEDTLRNTKVINKLIRNQSVESRL